MTDGYAFEVPPGVDWRVAPDDDWDTVMLVRSEIVGAVEVGNRFIDGYQHTVYHLTDGRHVAQLDRG